MITILIVLLGSLTIASMIYMLNHFKDIVLYLHSVHWVRATSEWISTLPEFVQIFLSVLISFCFIVFTLYSLRKLADL